MYASKAALNVPLKARFPKFNPFSLADRELIRSYTEAFKPESCEYNFANLFTWQESNRISWTLYRDRLLIHDGLSGCTFMPLGKELYPEDLVILSLNLKSAGLSPNLCLATADYINRYPEIETYYSVIPERDYAEYIYDVESLCELSGVKLHKKKNLISQFKRLYPEFETHLLEGEYRDMAFSLSQELVDRRKRRSQTLDHEMNAITQSFENFEELDLEGLALTWKGSLIAFSIFSRLDPETYDIQFEKADPEYKGAAQVINHETANYLRDKCRFLNREQDLGIKGLRQAKMSYDPVKLITPHSLNFTPCN